MPLTSRRATGIAIEIEAEKLVVLHTVFYPCRNNGIFTLLTFMLKIKPPIFLLLLLNFL